MVCATKSINYIIASSGEGDKEFHITQKQEAISDIESDNEDDYIPDDGSYFSDDNDALRFGSSMLQRQGLTKIVF